MPTHIRPVIFANSVRFAVPSFSQREMLGIAGVSIGPSKNPKPCKWEQKSYPEAMWVSIEDDHTKRRPCPSPYHEVKEFSLGVQDRAGADQTNWRPCLCPHRPNMSSSSWIYLNTSRPMPQTDSLPSPPPPYIGTQAPELEPPVLVSCDICWWVHRQPLHL